ncbi:salutaridinol 7-O-acetyltransferase-like [Malus sylvestris]|uniref:limonoid 7-O-acetyltransferse-like n=1 Tax=Malus domestica TaxID=3750 RepID=UPI0021AD16D3|nr:salutaridinol 7-O-acetyltransferase-like [Malus sylvestris]
MVKEMKVEIISRKTIRPSSPTPHHHKNFKLSLLDQRHSPNLYGNMIFFYSSTSNYDHTYGDFNPHALKMSSHLQKSLSKTLVHFYPLAGRLKDAATIECNDQGVYFVEARMDCHLLNFLSQPDSTLFQHFIPTSSAEKEDVIVLLVQLTVFNCGGIAIAVSLLHKIADASSLCTFVQSWTAASTALDQSEFIGHDQRLGQVLPLFIGSSLLPPSEMLITRTLDIPDPHQNFTTRRFVFSTSKMASLKAKAAITTNNPTNVELVSAVVVKCAIAAAQSISTSSSRPSVLFHAMNLRKRMVSPLPANTVGNLVWAFPVLIEESDIKLHEVVVKLRKGLTDFCNDKANRFKGEDGFAVVSEYHTKEVEFISRGVNIFRCTSLCKFPIYDMDFGWGKPTWVATSMGFKNFIVLIDSKLGENIEAWVTLAEQEMAIFQRDEMLLSFASLNPSAAVHESRM